MARKPLQPCKTAGCNGLTREAYCTACSKRQGRTDGKRPSAAGRGYGAAWKRLRALKLRETPLCEQCAEMGRDEPATVVHHLDPISSGGKVLCPIERLQSVCLPCHSKGEGWGHGH